LKNVHNLWLQQASWHTEFNIFVAMHWNQLVQFEWNSTKDS